MRPNSISKLTPRQWSVATDDTPDIQRRLDDIADIVCRGLATSLPRGEDTRVLAAGLAIVALGYRRKKQRARLFYALGIQELKEMDSGAVLVVVKNARSDHEAPRGLTNRMGQSAVPAGIATGQTEQVTAPALVSAALRKVVRAVRITDSMWFATIGFTAAPWEPS